MNNQEFLHEVIPINVLDVIDEAVLSHLIDGFSVVLKSGVSILYPTEILVTRDSLARKDINEPEAFRMHNHICAYWRDADGCNMKSSCFEADKDAAMKYFNGEWNGLRIYCCKPLGLWDMSFPLCIDSKIVGILFGGQIIIEEHPTNWLQSLQKYKESIDWETVGDWTNHSQAIQSQINTYSDLANKEALLRRFLAGPDFKRDIVTLEEFITRIKNFEQLGHITERHLCELYKAKRIAAENQILRNYDTRLATLNLTDPNQWWTECINLFSEISAFCEINDVQLYSRSGSRYLCKNPRSSRDLELYRISVRKVISAFPAGKLMIINDSELISDIGMGNIIRGFRSENGNGRESCSTLILISGQIKSAWLNFVEQFCTEICEATDIAGLIFRERDKDFEFRQKVALIGHSFRTPLQALQFELESIGNSATMAENMDLLEKVRNGMALIREAREDLFLLLDDVIEKEEEFNLIENLTSVIKNMEPIARKKPCLIVKRNDWPTEIKVFGKKGRIQRAITCLLDNAIKYSYSGNIYEARIEIKMEFNYAKIILSNYGIGIPEHKLRALSEYGSRGNVEDGNIVRPGTGLGLPFAIDTFDDFGGWIHVSSMPDPRGNDEDKRTYHRYITTVEAALPILRRK
ncbi:MAG TPA: PocR ligand-binding domain-containing protein [Anaerolineales bacterium]|nr:PocR ligand-binding domain-containing protein [Anaerolineales bacterium]